MMKGT